MPHPSNPIPLHRRIADELARQIAEGELPPGSRLPAEPELAARFGVSRGTIRQSLARLRDGGFVTSVPGRGSFVNRATPPAPASRRRVVGVVVPSVAEPFVPDLLGWIEDELHARGYSMLVGSSGANRRQQAGRIHRILEEGTSGLIAYPIDYDPDPALFGHLATSGFPTVLIDRHLVGVSIDAVGPDNVGGAFAAVSHLAQLGHRRIGFVSTDNLATTSVAERLHGYRLALEAHGLEARDELVFAELKVRRRWPHVVPAGEPGEAASVERWLRRERPTAIFTLHDALAADVLDAAGAMDLRVPEDLAIATFDDDPLATRLTVPLTAVAQPREQIGRLAAGMVVDRIEGRRTDVSRVVLPTSLVVRRSSGAMLDAAAEA